MGADKKIREIVNISENEVKERNKGFYHKTVSENFANQSITKSKPKFSRRMAAMLSSVICVLLAFGIASPFIFKKADDTKYTYTETSRISTMEELNGIMKGANIHFSDEFKLSSVSPACIYDKKSGKDIFYSIGAQKIFSVDNEVRAIIIDMQVIFEKGYQGMFNIIEPYDIVKINGFEVKYRIASPLDIVNKRLYEILSEVSLDNEVIKIKYQSTKEDFALFENFISQTITKKII